MKSLLSLLWVSLCIITGAGHLSAAPVNAYVCSVSGTVEFAPPQSISFQPLAKGQILELGSTVRTGDDGKVCVSTTPGSAIELGNDSVLKINELAFAKAGGVVTERKARLELTSGVVSALIDPSTPKITDFRIQTPQGAVAARGTFYSVAVKNGKSYVSIDHGKIAITAAPSRQSL